MDIGMVAKTWRQHFCKRNCKINKAPEMTLIIILLIHAQYYATYHVLVVQ